MIKTEARIINQVNSTIVADGSRYVMGDMSDKIRPSDPDTKNVISSTFGMIKSHILELLNESTGFDPNVNYAYQMAMTDPTQCVEYQGHKFYQHPGVGAIIAYNDSGNPAQGCFTMHTMA